MKCLASHVPTQACMNAWKPLLEYKDDMKKNWSERSAPLIPSPIPPLQRWMHFFSTFHSILYSIFILYSTNLFIQFTFLSFVSLLILLPVLCIFFLSYLLIHLRIKYRQTEVRCKYTTHSHSHLDFSSVEVVWFSRHPHPCLREVVFNSNVSLDSHCHITLIRVKCSPGLSQMMHSFSRTVTTTPFINYGMKRGFHY